MEESKSQGGKGLPTQQHFHDKAGLQARPHTARKGQDTIVSDFTLMGAQTVNSHSDQANSHSLSTFHGLSLRWAFFKNIFFY